MTRAVRPTGIENILGEDELIVSKTDLKGRITYANDVFIRMAKYPWKELVGAPHSLVRHPDMPRCVFKLLWDTLQAKREIFAYVVNLAGDGSHYWVFAHVTPTLDDDGNITGYHSNRRKPDRGPIDKISPLAIMECKICWTVYDPALGDEVWQIPPGTPFYDLPAHWTCPNCSCEKQHFLVLDD